MSSYSIELNYKELVYVLFKKKKCPKCSQTMKRQKRVENIGEGFDTIKLGEVYYGERYEISLYYRCKNCNILYSVRELACSK